MKYRFEKILLIIVGALLVTVLETHAAEIKGTVKCAGKGVKNVVVTDGQNFTMTDHAGKYKFFSTNASFVYISTPSGYITKVNHTIPSFYKKLETGHTQYDFEIIKNPYNDVHHVFIAQADVQLTDHECLEEYKKMLPDCVNLLKSSYSGLDVFGVDCGDIVGDTPALYPDYIEASDILNIPVFRAIGNHDMDYYGRSFETSHGTFEKYFGPTYYSFNKGLAHYIVLNDNFFIGRDYFYMGYLNEKALHWLEQDLSYVSKDSPVFIIMHIPSQLQEQEIPFEYNYSAIADQMVNAGAFHKMLENYQVHILSGHMHYNRNLVYNNRLMEHITGAVCGTWWRSDVGLDGTPRGYGVYEIDGDKVSWYYKSAGYDKNYQMRTYAPGSSSEFPADVIANVWNWDKNWKVEWLENGILMGEMTHFTGNDPLAEKLCSDKEKMKYDWISVNPTDHLFRATPTKIGSKVEVKVTDRFGHVYLNEIK